MLSSSIPTKVPLAWAASGTKNTIPTASQIGITPGAASLTDGFPPLTFQDPLAGGVAPSGGDFNGILNLITAVQAWQCAGSSFKYDSAFSTAIGGYPKGAILISADNTTEWLSTVESNATDPDGGSPAGWAMLAAYGISAVSGLTNVNVTLTPAQYGKNSIVCSGTLTGNVQIIFPKLAESWTLINSTTGAFTLSAVTSGGTPVASVQGAAISLRGDGTNVINDAVNISEPASADNSSKAVNSRWAKLGLLFSIGVSGYIKFPDWLSGLIIQWGTTNLNFSAAPQTLSGTVTYPLAFPLAVYTIFATANTSVPLTYPAPGVVSSTLSQFLIYGYGASNNASQTYFWLAFGK